MEGFYLFYFIVSLQKVRYCVNRRQGLLLHTRPHGSRRLWAVVEPWPGRLARSHDAFEQKKKKSPVFFFF